METSIDRIDEVVALENWIHEQLTRSGFTEYEATVAIDEDLDWRTMVRLRERGCPTGLALAIVK